MEDSVYEGDITSRSVIHLASQEVSKYRTPVPVLQPDQSTCKKSTKKRSHSALAVHNVTEDLNISPRTLIDHTCKEKISRKSFYFPKDDENLQIQLDRRRSRRSLHAPTDQYGDISVEENEDTVESNHSAERVNERDLPLPPTVQNHDEVAAQSEDRVPATRASRRKNKTTPLVSARETKMIVEHFAGMKLSRGALNSIMESTDLFWQKTFEAVEAYAKHANRDTIEVRDVELLLYRQRHAHDRHSMNALIARYMPMELRSQIIPMATPGNILIP